jgi:hypothetical protein
MTRTVATALPVWLAVVVALVVIALVVPIGGWWPLFAAVAAGAVLLTFVIQVSLQSKEGLVMRMLVTVTGVVLVLMVASAATLIVQATLGSAS